MIRVAFVATECVPFMKTGGLADVVGSLPTYLKEQGVQVSVILPKTSALPHEFVGQLQFIDSFPVYVTWRKQHCGVFTLTHNDVDYYFVDNEYYFARDNLYGYADDGERFAFFNHAVIEMLYKQIIKIDIIHCHDWQTALLPTYLQTKHTDLNIKSIFTIHNLHYQGCFPLDSFYELLHFNHSNLTDFEYNNTINWMKAAIIHCDVITTVSPTYADEITTPLGGEGLNQILAEHKGKLTGILNGIDTVSYDPLIDASIVNPYYHDPISKSVNKTALQEELHLPKTQLIPLFSMITRLVENKGLDLFLTIADELLSHHDLQLVIVGTGEPRLEQALLDLQSRYPSKVRTVLGFYEHFARKVYAASDFLLMPSLFEPCGLSQLIALQYEAVPIVRETGGLKDTILAYNKYTKEGNGLSFTKYNAYDFLYTIRLGLSYFHTEDIWPSLLNNVYQSSFNWSQSAHAYFTLYKTLTDRRGVSSDEHNTNRICSKFPR